MTTSGYPKQVGSWKRGTSLKDAQLIHEGKSTEGGIWSFVLRDCSITHTIFFRDHASFQAGYSFWMNNKSLIKFKLPLIK